MPKTLIICAERSFSIKSSRILLIEEFLKFGYEIEIITTGTAPEEIYDKENIYYNELKTWISLRSIFLILSILRKWSDKKLIVYNTKPLFIVAVCLLFVNTNSLLSVGVFTGLGRLSNLQNKISIFSRIIIQIIGYSYNKLIFQNKCDLQLVESIINLKKK